MPDLKLGNIALIYWMIDSFIQGRMVLPPSIKSRTPNAPVPSICMQKAPPLNYKFEDEKWIVVSSLSLSLSLDRIWNFGFKFFITIHCGFIQLCFGNDFLLVNFLLINTTFYLIHCHCIFFISATVIPNISISIYSLI